MGHPLVLILAGAVLLAACSQLPAPARVIATGVDDDMPPLPPPLPDRRLEQVADLPPLPQEKPALPQPATGADPEPAPALGQAPQPESTVLLADVEAALLAPAAETTPEEIPLEGAVGYVTVLPGDTVYALSRRYDVAVKDLIAVNGLTEPYHLLVGQDIRLPSQRYHTVEPGESLIGVARRYGKSPDELIALNELAPPYLLFVGQRLAIPDEAGAPSQAASTETGETVVAELAMPETIAMPSRGSLQFIWPVRGSVISTYGPKEDGLQNDGINIAAPAGTPVVAAEEGVVAYVGNELRGYGNLILIRHAEGWVSAYAHNAETRVARGQRVTRGQIIATVGATGGVPTPQSHFELRRNGEAVDPVRWLTSG